MSNIFYNLLRGLVGEPLKTERVYMGLSAARIDYFSCGCQRVYIARSVGDQGEAEEQLWPCPDHKGIEKMSEKETSPKQLVMDFS